MNEEIKQLIEEEYKRIISSLSPLDRQAKVMDSQYYWENHFRDGFNQATSFILSKWQEANRWRKVSEELPDMGFRVLIKNNFNVIHMGYIDTVGDWRYCLNNTTMLDKPIEWKPID